MVRVSTDTIILVVLIYKTAVTSPVKYCTSPENGQFRSAYYVHKSADNVHSMVRNWFCFHQKTKFNGMVNVGLR